MKGPLRDHPARRIVIIKPSALGDIVHSLPVLSALRRRYPDSHIAWIVNRAYERLLHGHPDLDETLPLDRDVSRVGWVQSALSYARFVSKLRRRNFDLVIDLQGLLRTGLLTLFSRAARRVGLSSARECAAWFYSDVVPVPDQDDIHAVDRYWLVAEALGAGDGPKRFHIPLSTTEQRPAAELLAGWPRPWMLFGVGSRWKTKRWPPEHFAALARMAQSRFGGTIVFVGSRDEMPLARAVSARLAGPTRDLTGLTSLPRLAALLALADVMVANDTGPLHLAAALGRPVVAPYTCTRVVRNGPFGVAAGAVEASIWCQGSYRKRCDRMECMSALTPDHLWPLLREILLSWESNRHSA